MVRGTNEMSEYKSAVQRIMGTMEASGKTMTEAEARTVLQDAGIITPKGNINPAFKDIVVKKGNIKKPMIITAEQIEDLDIDGDLLAELQKRKVDWEYISYHFTLSEAFIRTFQKNVDWFCISEHQTLSEYFIREFKDEVDWSAISFYQVLSEDFIREFYNRVDWWFVSGEQKLSENFIREFKDWVNWERVSKYQKLSEDFIAEFKDRVDWECISKYQKLSENFIKKYGANVVWVLIGRYQKLSPAFIEEFPGVKPYIKDSWHYVSTEFKKQRVINTGLYKCGEDSFIAYKGIKRNNYSVYNRQHRYLPGETHEDWADCSSDEKTFGLSAWTYEHAKKYSGEKVVKVEIRYEDVARIVGDNGKIRCCKLKVLEEIE